MPRVSILDSILNRPSQSYTPETSNNAYRRSNGPSGRWAPPPDLPNANGAPSSILSGNMFRRRPSQTFSAMGSDAGRSTIAGSTIGGGSRFGRKKKRSYAPSDLGSQYAPSSVADSTATRSKSRWWSTGSVTFGRRSRAPSIAGDSIFSEPPDRGQVGSHDWSSMTGVGAHHQQHQPRVSRSDYGGGSRSRQSYIPPVPKVDSRYTNLGQPGHPPGRLQSNVAPLGSTSLNPSLNKKPSKSRVSSASTSNLNNSYNGVNNFHRAISPPPLNRSNSYTNRVSSPPPGRVSSPPLRPLSPTFSESGRSVTSLQTGAQDWKDFVKSMSGSEVSKVWENSANVSNIGAALNNSKAVNGVERRRSNMMRLQKELEQDAQYQQIVRDPGVIQQDLLARAASQVVGLPPMNHGNNVDQSIPSHIRPGIVIPSPQQAEQINRVNDLSPQIIRPAPIRDPTALPIHPLQEQKKQSQESSSEEEEGTAGDSDEDSSESEKSERERQQLEVVNEEEEESSSVGHEMRPHQTSNGILATSAAKYKAFDAALKRSSTLGHGSPDESASPSVADHTTSANDHASPSTSPSRMEHSQSESSVAALPTTTIATSEKDVVLKGSTLDQADTPKVAPQALGIDLDSDEKGGLHAVQLHPTEVHEIDEKGEEDTASIHSTQTGKATVKFDQDAKEDAQSIDSNGTLSRPKSVTGSVRPGTLSRRLSDLSLGTSFGVSGILRGSRSSTRIKLNDGDSDSVKSLSDEEGDNDLKKRIREEQERLRSMKVGEDFFGGSLSSILDKFGASTFESEPSNAIGQLDLDVGSPGRSTNKDGVAFSTQEILSMNAQERINEVRRLRSNNSTSIKGDAMTVQSGIAPSFAALWLLNQAESTPAAIAVSNPLESKANTPPKAKGHARQLSTTSSDGNTSMTRGSASSRIKSFFSPPTSSAASASTIDRKTSVMDRPRGRKPKPNQMGGVPISKGKLTPEKKGEIPEDTRSTLPGLAASQTLSQMKDAWEKAETMASSSPPSSPVVKPIDQPSSKDKPAPKKSALKPKKSKSLADTLFSFASASPEKKARNLESKRALQEEKQLQKNLEKAKVLTKDANEDPDMRITPKRTRSGSGSVYATPDKELDLPPFASPTKIPTFHTAPDFNQNLSQSDSEWKRIQGFVLRVLMRFTLLPSVLLRFTGVEMSMYSFSLKQLQKPAKQEVGSGSESETEEIWKPALPEQPESAEEAAVMEDEAQEKLDEHTPSSEIWSGESVASTGPTTPGASDILDRHFSPPITALFLPPLATRRSDSPKVTSMNNEKKLPMPPAPIFEEKGKEAVLGDDTTPLAVARADPIYLDNNKTPMGEAVEPTFGMNLIPPTPPALESYNSYTSVSTQKLRGVTPDTVEEHPDEDGTSTPALIQQSNPIVKSTTSSFDVARKSSKKKNSHSSMLNEYQGQGINLPPGLVATTVASSASRRHSDNSARPSTGVSEPSTDGTIKKRKSSKGKKSSNTPSRTYAQSSTISEQQQDSSDQSDSSHQHSSSALRESLANAPPVPSMLNSSSSLAIPSSRSETTNSSNGSDGGSNSPSPAPSASGRSAMSSSNASFSASSDMSSPKQHYPRKIRTLSAGPNGQARTSIMSAISEWERSPVGGNHREDPMSPMPNYADSSVSENIHTMGQNNLSARSSPSFSRNIPMLGGTENYLHPSGGRSSQASFRQTESLDGHGGRPWRASYMSSQSDMISLDRAQSGLTLPAVPSAPQSVTGYKSADHIKATNAIDDRLYAKTTMTTVAVTSGAFRNKSLRKRRSSADVTSLHAGGDSARSSRVSLDTMPDGLVEELQRTTMSMTAHTPPPRKLSSTQVLVQIITVAIDETDRQLLREKIRSENAYGFVPGRSFCGRIMETGWEVKRMRKGDVVFGLQSSRKCGALAEFMTIDQDLIAKAPEDCLTTEEIAALPAVGVMAYQMMLNHCSQLKRGSRILILNAHDGVGLLTMQEANNLGLIIVAHCPDSISDGVTLCEANGAHEVVVGDALWALNSLHESSFDLVLDTVGGRRIYDAARRILAFEGQFCTCVGDVQSSVNPNLKSHLRSLRRSFFKKDTKRIGYEWIATDMGEDCREALEAVKAAAEKGRICPRLQSILLFPEAPKAFEVTLRGGQTEPGSVVVRVS